MKYFHNYVVAVFIFLSISFFVLTRYVNQPKKEVETIIQLKYPNKCCRVGEPVMLKAGIWNPMNAPVNFVTRGRTLFQSYEFTITDENNVKVSPMHDYGTPSANDPTGVTTAWPHKTSEEDEIVLNEFFDFSKSGTYKIICRAKPSRADYSCKNSKPLFIKIRK